MLGVEWVYNLEGKYSLPWENVYSYFTNYLLKTVSFRRE